MKTVALKNDIGKTRKVLVSVTGYVTGRVGQAYEHAALKSIESVLDTVSNLTYEAE